ncbi:hypothetical protein [uncultured Clostridium sp.]|uniref:hypothetical protein n=1 Tax=uncultured Clostridium sp. TaxID=59620 RepID=UPI002672AD35|nr:hypothetical protein [uncultured Clostridium sp.]
MNTKEILQKQNALNTLSKKNKNKLLAVFLSGGLVSCTIGAQVVSAQSIDTFSYENYKNSINAKKIPGLTKKTITFNMAHPTDLVIDNIDLSGLTVSELMVYAKRIDPSKLRITQNSITIPKEEILALKFTPNRLYNTSINFTDGSYASGYIFINIINDPSIPPNTDSDSGSSKPEEDSSGKDDITNKPEQKPDDNDNTGTPNNPDDNKNDTETNPDQDSSDNNKPNGDTENTHIPTINRENFVFNRDDAKDLVIQNVDLNGLTITDIYMYGAKMDVNKVKVVDNSIVISKEAIFDLGFKNGTYYLAFHFSNGAIISNYVSITITDSDNVANVKPPQVNENIGAIIPPPNSNPDNNNNNNNNNNNGTPNPDNNSGNDSIAKPPTSDDKVEIIQPEVEKQTIVFNRDNATDIVIKNVDFKGLTLTEFYIYGRKIDINKLKITENSITIPKEVIFDLYLKNSTYYTSAIFSNGTYVSGVAAIQIVDNDILNPGNKDEYTDDTIRQPNMITQNFEFDLSNPMGIEITHVNFDGTKLKNITIGNKILNSSKFSTTDNSIIISADVLKSLNLDVNTHQIVFTFSNGVTLSGYSDLIVVNSTNITTKPMINVNANTNGEIEIPNLIPEGSKITSITINNKILDVIYRDNNSYLRTGYTYRNSKHSVYIENNKLFIPIETLSYISSNSNNYKINIRLDDGSSISQEIYIKSDNNSNNSNTNNNINGNNSNTNSNINSNTSNTNNNINSNNSSSNTNGNYNTNNNISSNTSNNKYTSTVINTSSSKSSNITYANNTINTNTTNELNKNINEIKNDVDTNTPESITSSANATTSSNIDKSVNDTVIPSSIESSSTINSKKSFIPKFIAICTGLFVAILAILSGLKFTKKNN